VRVGAAGRGAEVGAGVRGYGRSRHGFCFSFVFTLAPTNNAGPCGHHRVQGVPVQVCRYLYRYLWSNLASWQPS
jgi:hypothetical protein